MSERLGLMAARTKAALGGLRQASGPRIGLAVLVLAPLLAVAGMTGSASAAPVKYCAQIPIVGGIPPWGFHTGAPITAAT